MSAPVYKQIEDNIPALATRITELHFREHPKQMERYGPAGREHCYKDAEYHLSFLTEALKLDHPEMYGNYIVWASAMLEHRNIPKSDLENNIRYLSIAIQEIIGESIAKAVVPYTKRAKELLRRKSNIHASYITDDNPLKIEANRYLHDLLDGQRGKAKALIDHLVETGTYVKDIYQHIFQPTQYEIGHLWQCNKITVAHEHYCTAATQLIMSGLYPHIFSTKRIGKTVVACSVASEMHEMGIRMVSDFFEMEGWDTYYLGANMPERQLQQAIQEHNADVLAISVTLPTHVSRAETIIQQIKNNPQFANVKIIVGGYTFLENEGLWKKIGADGFAENAEQAISTAQHLIR